MRWTNLSAGDERSRRLPSLTTESSIRTFDAPEALDVRFHEIHAKSAINRIPASSRLPFRFTINPYRGCAHACAYCFARETHKYLDLNAGRDFEREIVVKVNTPELVRAELSRPGWKGETVALGTNTDPYQWVESRYELMPGVWEAMRDASNPCSLVTKSPLVLRDLPILKQIAERTEIAVYLSVPTLDEQTWRATEPHTPSPRARLKAVRKLNDAGVPAGVMVAPLLPGINDQPEQVAEIVRMAEEANAISIGSVALHLRGDVRDVWFEWLEQHHPELIPRYERLYSRGAYAPANERKRLASLVRPRRRRATRRSTPQPRPRAEAKPQQTLF